MSKIMVVDDEPDVVNLIEDVLKADGIECVSAYDGLGALDLAAEESPDLILLDIMMPMMSGYEVAAQLKANPGTKDIPVLCISSGHSADARVRSRQAGAVGILFKPFTPAELLAQIRVHLEEGAPPASDSPA